MREDSELIMQLLLEARWDAEIEIDDPLVQQYPSYRRKADLARSRLAQINAEIARRIPQCMYNVSGRRVVMDLHKQVWRRSP